MAEASTVGRPRGSIRAGLRWLANEPAVRRRLLLYGSAAGYGMGIAALILIINNDGGMGYDAYAYWQAGRNVLEGQPLYWAHDEGALGAFRYPPLFAQLWAPFALMPALAFSWAWRIICLLSLRYLAGSWRNVGVWMLVPFTLTELSIGNVTLPVAAMSVMALRGRGWMAGWAGAVKFGPMLLLPYLWFAQPAFRRSLVIGVATLAGACAASFALAPDSWMLYLAALSWMSASSTESFGVIAILPDGLADAILRLAIGIALVLFAIGRGSDRLAFTASIIAVPVLAIWRLVPLLALPRLGRRT